MTKIIITIVLLVTSQLFSQGQFEQGMGKAFGLWKEGKTTEASDLFERIAAYLPRFFIGYWILNEAGFLSGFLFYIAIPAAVRKNSFSALTC